MHLFRLLFLLFLLSCSIFLHAQQEIFRWNNDLSKYELDFKTYNPEKALDSLAQNGFYTLKIDSVKANRLYINKGKNYKRIWVKNQNIFNNSKFNPTYNLDSIISKSLHQNDEKGYAFSQIKLIPNGEKNGEQKIELIIDLGKNRTIDGVKSIGYTKLSKGFIKHGLGLKTGKIYNESILNQANQILENTNFVELVQNAQTLFKPDSTIVYIYPKKIKSNQFDGIIGFGNDETGKFKLNGNVILELNNVFNGLEQIKLNWIATATKNTTLDLRVKIPYLFKTPIGSETNFKIFKQDSVFTNLELNERLFYQINPNANIGADLKYMSSNYLLSEEFNANYDDYTKVGLGISYDYFQKHPIQLMEGKSMLRVFTSSITRKEKNFSWTEDIQNETSSQYEIGISTYRIFQPHPKHHIKTLANFKFLLDENNAFSENELYRIGGFGSIRGFNEESVLANLYGIASLEYRFLPNDGFYISLFSDYAFTENKRNNLTTNLYSFGTGISFLSKLGIFNLSYAVGKTEKTPFDFQDSKIHFGIISQF